MIVTLTPNPSLDRTIEIPELHRGEVHRATGGRVDPGGKGVNVSRALAGRRQGHDRGAAVRRHGGRPARGAARAVRGADGAGADRGDGAEQHHRRRARRHHHQAQRGRAGAHAGRGRGRRAHGGRARRGAPAGSSAPAACPAGWATTSTPGSSPRCASTDIQVCIDASGPPLVAAVDAGPDLIKPNAEELAELVGRPLRRLGDVVDACAEVRKRGVATVLVSLGGDGALLVNADEVLHGWAPPGEGAQHGRGGRLDTGGLSRRRRARPRGARDRHRLRYGGRAAARQRHAPPHGSRPGRGRGHRQPRSGPSPVLIVLRRGTKDE